jgi:hypothetical protein
VGIGPAGAKLNPMEAFNKREDKPIWAIADFLSCVNTTPAFSDIGEKTEIDKSKPTLFFLRLIKKKSISSLPQNLHITDDYSFLRHFIKINLSTCLSLTNKTCVVN